MIQAQNMYVDERNRIEKIETTSSILDCLLFDKDAKCIHWNNEILFNKWH